MPEVPLEFFGCVKQEAVATQAQTIQHLLKGFYSRRPVH